MDDRQLLEGQLAVFLGLLQPNEAIFLKFL